MHCCHHQPQPCERQSQSLCPFLVEALKAAAAAAAVAKCHHCHSNDQLEALVDDEHWPLPKYREMLFVK